MGQSQPLRSGSPGDLDCVLRVQMGPHRASLPGLVGALCDEQVCILCKAHSVLADTCVWAVGNYIAVQVKAVAERRRGVNQEAALHGEGKLVRPLEKLVHIDGEGEPVQGNSKGLVDDGLQDRLCALLAIDLQRWKAELVDDVQALDVVQVEVGEEEVDGPLVLDESVCLVDAVASVEEDVVLLGADEGADGVARLCVVPAVGAKESYLHINSPESQGLPHCRSLHQDFFAWSLINLLRDIDAIRGMRDSDATMALGHFS